MNLRTSLTILGASIAATVTHGSAALACTGGQWDQYPSIGAINESSIGTLSVDMYPTIRVFSHETWSGNRKVLFGNVDGKPGSEAIAINNENITVKTWDLPADGSAPSYNNATTWFNAPFYGNVDTLVADMDNDGRDDIVAWNTNNIAFVRSNGAGFDLGKYITWGPSDYYGTVASLVGDVNGDKFPDLVAWNATSIGISFFQPGNGVWGAVQVFNQSMRGDAANYSGDVNGDGRMDLISIRARLGKDPGTNSVLYGQSSGGFATGSPAGYAALKGAHAYFALPTSLSPKQELYEVWGTEQRVWRTQPPRGPSVLTNTPFFGTRLTGPAWTPFWRVNVC